MDNSNSENSLIKKTALISILGRPNAGKSTLLNTIIGQKISIVTPKVQTTRSIIKGIYTSNDTQLIFMDTPGIFTPKKTLEKAMVRNAWSSIVGADIICLIIDITNDKNFDLEFEKILTYLAKLKTPKIIIFNKLDIIAKDDNINNSSIFEIKNLEENLQQYNFKEEFKNKALFFKDNFKDDYGLFISAKKNNNVPLLLNFLKNKAPISEWLFNEDEVTTAPMRFLSSEITREQLFLKLSDELPYNLTVETESWEQINPTEAKIYQNIIVNRDAHKKIILGKNGSKIKEISTQARIEISKALDMKMHLFLFVKVREDWDNKSIYYSNIGLEFPKT